jgi:prepilin-type N-terminal cleavage/methylation domain-containing protein
MDRPLVRVIRADITIFVIYRHMSQSYIRLIVKKSIHHYCAWNGVSNRRGFSLLELLVVVAVLSVISVVAIPNMMTVISNARLQGGGTNLSGILQNSRSLAIGQNTTMSTHFTVLGNGPVAFIKTAGDTSPMAHLDPQVQLGAPLIKETTPIGPGAPAALTTAELGFTAATTDPSFNSRGLPCAFSGGVCPTSGFVYYFRDNRPMGKSGWIAVSISPAGRIKRWIYSGTSWGG